MRIIIIIAMAVLFGCTPQASREDQEQPLQENNEEMEKVYVKMPDKYAGTWVSDEYLGSLKKTKSTKQSQEVGDGVVRIREGQLIMRMTMHEGGPENIILMDSENKGHIYSPDSAEVYNDIQFREGKLIIDSDKYTQAPGANNDISTLINSSFISGRYMVGENTVELKENGSISGLDSISSYVLNLDYIDAGMQFDKVYLQFKNEKESRTYIYELDTDTLIIYEIDCITQSEEYNYCVEVAKGTIKYKLIKN